MQKWRGYLLSVQRGKQDPSVALDAQNWALAFWEGQLPNPMFGSLLPVFTPRTARGRGGMLRAKKQAFLSMPGLATWDGCQLEGSIAAKAIASLGTATRTAAVLAWDCSCWCVSSIKLCFPAQPCQLLATARSLNHTPWWLLKCWETTQLCVILYSVSIYGLSVGKRA